MDKRIIKVEVPLLPSQINEYCRANAEGNNNILFEFDVSNSPLDPQHIFGYLSNLKIDFRVVGHDKEFMIEYFKSPFLVGRSNLIDGHKTAFEQNISHVQDQLTVIRSLPLFLIESAQIPESIKTPVVGGCEVTDEILDGVGVNFVHLITDPEFFLLLIGDKVFDFDNQKYYTQYFDKYIYGGDSLIQFFTDNPDNLLHEVLRAALTK